MNALFSVTVIQTVKSGQIAIMTVCKEDRPPCVYLKKMSSDESIWNQHSCQFKPPSILRGIRYIDSFTHCTGCENYATGVKLVPCKDCLYNLTDFETTGPNLFCNKISDLNDGKTSSLIPSVDPEWSCSKGVFCEK